MSRMAGLFALGLVLPAWATALAHEARPAYLEITETAPGHYEVLWRTPLLSGMRLPGSPSSTRLMSLQRRSGQVAQPADQATPVV
jgi:hypothetical protein